MEISFEIFQGGITRLAVDAIVNAANSTLLGGGGVDGAIHRAAGPNLKEECRKIRGNPRCPRGEARITRGWNLPAKHVIHSVGPIWIDGNSGEDETLRNCYESCMRLAEEYKITSIAFPAISTGIYCFPGDRAAKIAVKTVQDYANRLAGTPAEKPLRVIFVAYDKGSEKGKTRAYYENAFRERGIPFSVLQ